MTPIQLEWLSGYLRCEDMNNTDDKTYYNITKKASLLLAGALIGIAAVPFENIISDNLFWIIILLSLLALYGFGMNDIVINCLYGLVTYINKKLKYICIYAPHEIDENNSSWVNIGTGNLKTFLIKKDVKCRVGKKETVFQEYPIIINPYGGVYPENNSSKLKSLDKIFQYVRGGGIYINIADIPFYYAYDTDLKRRIDTTPLAGDFSMQRSFLKTMLTKKLNHYVFGITRGSDFKKGITRIIQLSETSENLFQKVKFDDGPQGDYSPILKIPYGKGYFIFSTLHITKQTFKSYIMIVVESALS